VPKPLWEVVGKAFTLRKTSIVALESAMQRAYGLHRLAQFREIGENRFVVRFSSEGDWNHAAKNGPWHFDFHPLLLKEYDGSVCPSGMAFDKMDIWVRVLDLPLDMMNVAYGKLIGGWIGEYISADVDEDGTAWGEELRIRVAIKVDQPLIREVQIRESKDQVVGSWFDIKYEKVPHFYFSYGLLIHQDDRCKNEEFEWGSGRGILQAK
jgi:hypothetical protein